MHNSKLIAFLKALNTKELTALGQYIRSPYFFSGRPPGRAIQLLDYLRGHHPQFQGPALNKAQVFQHLYPNQVFRPKKIDLLMSQLFKIVERFIIQHFQTTHPIDQQLTLAQFFRRKGMDQYGRKNRDKMQKQQQATLRRGDQYFHHQFRIAKELMLEKSSRGLRDSDLNLPEVHHQLDLYYLVNKLELACHLLAQNKHHRPVELGDAITLLDQLRPLLKKGRFDEVPLIKLYFEIYRWLREGKAPPENFVASLRGQGPYLPMDQLKSIHAFYRNDCVHRYNGNQTTYLPQLFEIYRLSLEEGLLFNQGGLLQSTLQNLVRLGLKMKEYDWVYNFLQAYSDKIIDTNNPQEVYANNLARYYFALREFDKALDCLSQDYEDTYYKISAKLIEIKIYYEQQSELLDYKIQAFKVYLHRISNTLLPELHKLGFKHFIDLLKQICHPSTWRNKERIDKLLAKLEARKVLAERDWLKEKLRALQ
ncbi:MAG: hypothetical protein AAGG75_19405 [Bacteroidota bacterium]